MFIGRWEFWPDTFMCIVLGGLVLAIAGWTWFIFFGAPWFAKRKDQKHPHRHKMVLDGFSPAYLHWSCVRNCPQKFGVYWNRKDFQNKTLNFPHSPSRGYTVVPINNFAVKGIPGQNTFQGFGTTALPHGGHNGR